MAFKQINVLNGGLWAVYGLWRTVISRFKENHRLLMFVVTAYDNFACLPRDDLSFFDGLRAGDRGRDGFLLPIFGTYGTYQYLVPLAPTDIWYLRHLVYSYEDVFRMRESSILKNMFEFSEIICRMG